MEQYMIAGASIITALATAAAFIEKIHSDERNVRVKRDRIYRKFLFCIQWLDETSIYLSELFSGNYNDENVSEVLKKNEDRRPRSLIPFTDLYEEVDELTSIFEAKTVDKIVEFADMFWKYVRAYGDFVHDLNKEEHKEKEFHIVVEKIRNGFPVNELFLPGMNFGDCAFSLIGKIKSRWAEIETLFLEENSFFC